MDIVRSIVICFDCSQNKMNSAVMAEFNELNNFSKVASVQGMICIVSSLPTMWAGGRFDELCPIISLCLLCRVKAVETDEEGDA